MKLLKFMICSLLFGGRRLVLYRAGLPTSRLSKPDARDAEKTMAKLSQLVGGTWINTDPKFVVENRYEWAFGKKVIRGLGVTGKGGPRETPIEAILGQDPVNKTVYYLDCHGGTRVQGNGQTGRRRSRLRIRDDHR